MWLRTLLGIGCLGVLLAGHGAFAAKSGCEKPQALPLKTFAYTQVPGVAPAFLSLDVYGLKAAKTDCAPAPVLVFVHGGGWRRGDKGRSAHGKPELFNNQGYVFVSINYELSPAAKHPRHVTDVALALAWVKAHIAEHGGDPARIALMGHSAGAHLVSLVATHPRYLPETAKLPLSTVRCVVSNDIDMYDMVETMQQGSSGQKGLIRAAFDTSETNLKDASPQRQVAANAGIGKFFVITRGHARRIASVQRFVDVLKSSGTSAELFNANPYTHEEVNTKIGGGGDDKLGLSAAVLKFLGSCLAL